MHRFGFYIL
ncbi:hypothetical protein NQ317_004892 [Molorchus minor]|uniref:Uncharacterized protein n=1 Tax=Molorchus minor TaxID=1323400 RepID=A0ABQ9IZT5_9CUCU|nr:hypothetical protein NQ317_004892 [Molorchus minor]